MIAVVTVLLAFPLGYFVRSQVTAYVAYIAAYGYAFTFQGIYLTRAWVGGDDSAFPADPDDLPLGYLVVSLAIYGVGFGLVHVGHRVRRRRLAKSSALTAAPADVS
jgi:hypothetical protein